MNWGQNSLYLGDRGPLYCGVYLVEEGAGKGGKGNRWEGKWVFWGEEATRAA